MKLAVDFTTKVHEQEFSVYAEGDVSRDFYDDPLGGEVTALKVQSVALDQDVTEDLTVELRALLEEVALAKLFTQYEEEYGRKSPERSDNSHEYA